VLQLHLQTHSVPSNLALESLSGRRAGSIRRGYVELSGTKGDVIYKRVIRSSSASSPSKGRTCPSRG